MIRVKHVPGFLHAQVEGVLVKEDVPSLTQALEEVSRHGPYAVITDTTNMKSAHPSAIPVFIAWLQKASPLVKDRWLADAVVIRSTAIRFSLSMILLVMPTPIRVQVFDSLGEAGDWLLVDVFSPVKVKPPAELLRVARPNASHQYQ